MTFPQQTTSWRWQQPGDAGQALRAESHPQPVLAADEVLIANHMIGLNPVDWKFIAAGAPFWSTGHIPGVDGAGEIVAVGADVDKTQLGRRVCFHQSLRENGSFSRHTRIKAERVLRMPDSLGMASAASFPCPAMTAWQALEKIPVQPNRLLLITGAAGSVARVLLQLAKARGFQVTALCRQPYHSALLALGADRCISEESEITTPFFAIFDTINGEHARSMAQYAAANGHLVCIQDRLESPPVAAFTTAISCHEVALNALHDVGSQQDWQRFRLAGEQLLQQLANGELIMEAPLVMPFGRLADAVDELHHHKRQLKYAVQVAE